VLLPQKEHEGKLFVPGKFIMQAGKVVHFSWPEVRSTVSIAALVMALMIFVFGSFSGARPNKIRIIFAVVLSR
jgi:hypothetical protein